MVDRKARRTLSVPRIETRLAPKEGEYALATIEPEAPELANPAPRRRLDAQPALVYLASLESESGHRSTESALRTFVGVFGSNLSIDRFPWEQLRYQHMMAAKARLVREGYAPKSVNKILSAARRVLKEAWNLGYVDHETYMRTRAVKNVNGSRLAAGRMLPPQLVSELRGIFSGRSALERRNTVMLFLLWGCGVRRKEASSMRAENIDRVARVVKVIGKRNKERVIPLSTEVLDVIDAWLEVRGTEPGPLLMPVIGGSIVHRHMSPQAIYITFARVQKRFGLAKFAPHDFRRTFISEHLRNNDVVSVAKMVGHDDPKTTMGYDLRDLEDQKRMVDERKMPT